MDQTKVRALEKRLLNAQTPADLLHSKAELAWALQKQNPKRTLELLEEIRQFREASDTAEAFTELAQSCYLAIQASLNQSSGRLAEGLAQAWQAYGLLQETPAALWLCRVLNLLGMIYMQLGDRALTTEYWLKLVEIAEQAQLPMEIAKAHNNLGWIALQAQDYQTAFASFQKALTHFKTSSPHNMVLKLCNLSQCCIHLEKYQEAAVYLAEAVVVCEQHNLQVEKNITFQRLALLAEKQGLLEKALELYLKALAITAPASDPFSRIPNLHAVGQIYIQLKQLERARPYLQEALALGEKAKRKQFLYESHRLLADVYKKAGEFEKALDHHEQFQQLKEQVFTEKSEQIVQNLQIIHQTDGLKREAALLKKQNALVADSVAKRTQELTELLTQKEQLIEQLKEALGKEAEPNQLRRRILETVSHEFRTSLTVISTSAALLAKKPEHLTPERQLEHHKRIQESIFYLTDLLQDLALVNDTAHLKATPPKRTHYQFNHMWLHLKQQLLYELNKPQNVVFLYDSQEMYPVKTNFEYLKQIVLSLITNALEYSTGNKLITIEATVNTEGEKMQVAVRDQGVGIPAADLPHIFELFYRASNVQTKKGLGVGLYIVKQLVTAMGGIITADSAGENQGSTFTMQLPVGSASQIGNPEPK